MLGQLWKQGFCCQQLESLTAPLGNRPGIEPHHLAVNLQGAALPADLEIIPLQQAGVGHALLALLPHPQAGQPFGLWARAAGFNRHQGFQHQAGSELGQGQGHRFGVVP